jgi:ubiquinone/menaquinone biosynthesis C-methylase UbiE
MICGISGLLYREVLSRLSQSAESGNNEELIQLSRDLLPARLNRRSADMPLYDFLAPAYDLAFESIHRPFRERVRQRLEMQPGACVLDLACGTGQNFPFLASLIGEQGHLIGLDISRGMLRRARQRVKSGAASPKVTLIHAAAAELTPALLQAEAEITAVDAVICSCGLTSMRDPEPAFHASWNLLRPGGIYLIHDIHAAPRTLHARAVELATFCRFSERAWGPLKAACTDFRMDYLDPSAHLFGGRLFVAWGTKPMPTHDTSHVPHHQQGWSAARALQPARSPCPRA